jgi:nicotinate-nucleotide pyrophosphorylase (carboxylating)
MAQLLDRVKLRRFWEQALTEDGADTDITSQIAIDERDAGQGRLIAKSPGVFAGQAIFDLLHEAYARQLTATCSVADGQRLEAGMCIGTLAGPLRMLLAIERTLLNFLQRLCGVATLTRAYVDAVGGSSVRIYDTRKTIPGWRQLDKYAVRCGGGHNHRAGLHDAILVKDNHVAGISPQRLAAAASGMLRRVATLASPPAFVEFEVDSMEQYHELLKVVGIDVILLDNFSPADMRAAVAERDALGLRGKLHLEASGGISLQSLHEIAATGVDRISVGAITHSAPAMDISLDIDSLTKSPPL